MSLETRCVDVRRIEPELRRLWREQARARPAAEPLLRARTLNLIVYSPDAPHEEIPALLDPLVVEHPARVIAIHPVHGKPAQAWISTAHMHAAAGRCIGRELITIECSPEAHRELHSVVLPLLVPDLPVCLWWRSRPGFGAELFEDLARAADRIVIDSDALANPLDNLPGLARAIVQTRGAVSDLAWARLTPWRHLAAQFFESPTASPYLRRLHSVGLEYGGELPSHALWLSGWLASRLGWERGSLTRAPFALHLQAAQPVHVEFRQAASGQGLVALRLAADEAEFMIARSAQCFVTIAKIGGQVLRRRVPRTDESETQMISRELDLPGHDRLYEEALAMMRALLEA